MTSEYSKQFDDRAKQEREATNLKLPKSTEHIFDDATYQMIVKAVKAGDIEEIKRFLGVKD